MKKTLLAAAAMMLFAGSLSVVQAQTLPGGTGAPATPQAVAPSSDATVAAPSTMAAPTAKKHAKRKTLQQRFEAANTTHDGHLTKEQAAAAKWGYVTKHFDAMDKGGKGYVTVAEIHGFSATAHAARAQHKAMTAPAMAAPATAAPATAAPATAAPATTE